MKMEGRGGGGGGAEWFSPAQPGSDRLFVFPSSPRRNRIRVFCTRLGVPLKQIKKAIGFQFICIAHLHKL